MDFDNKFPEWGNEGAPPPESLQSNGFTGGNKPPAGWLNWLTSLISKCVTELQTKLSSVDTNKANKENSIGGFEAGNGASANYGGAIGYGANTSQGGAVGWGANTTDGGAIGCSANTTIGGAVGYLAKSIMGGAVGHHAKAGDGFAGGWCAETVDSNDNAIDAIQLGSGTNNTEKTLQVYNYQLMDAYGRIPLDRLKNVPKVFSLKFPTITLSAQSTKDYTTSITITPSNHILIRAKDGNTAGLTYVSGVSYYTYTGSNYAVQFNSDGTIHFANSGSSSVTISNLEFIVIEKTTLEVSEVTR